MDINYWNQFYTNNPDIHQPSDFAKFVFSFLKSKKITNNLFDLGCGNARDTVFFALNNIYSHGIDQSDSAIKLDQNKNNLDDFLTFSNHDFTLFNFDSFDFSCPIKKYCLYSRFTLHAINYKEEDTLLNTIANQKNLEWLFIEARTIRDKIYGEGECVGPHEFVTSHYRRFIDPDIFIQKINNIGFDLIEFSESDGYSNFNNDNPVLMRIIAKKIS